MSSAWVPSQSKWLAMRFSSVRITRTACARGGASTFSSFLDRQAISQTIGYGGDIVHAVDVGIELRISAILGDLFHAAMQVADDAIGAQNFFAIELEDHAQHAVRRRVLRSHVEDQFSGI